MKSIHDTEFNFPTESGSTIDTYRENDKRTDMGKEFGNTNANVYADELNGSHRTSVSEDGKSRHDLLKRSVLFPVISVIAVLSVVHSSYHYDVLGYDLFGDSSMYSDYYYHDHYFDYHDDYYDDYYDDDPYYYPPESDPYYEPGEDVVSYGSEDMPLDYMTISPTYTSRELVSSRNETMANGVVLINESYRNVVFHVADDVSGFSEVSSQGDSKYIINEMKYRGLYVSDMIFREAYTTGGDLESTGVYVGDPDDLENVYIASGELTKKWVHEEFYDVYITTTEPN